MTDMRGDVMQVLEDSMRCRVGAWPLDCLGDRGRRRRLISVTDVVSSSRRVTVKRHGIDTLMCDKTNTLTLLTNIVSQLAGDISSRYRTRSMRALKGE